MVLKEGNILVRRSLSSFIAIEELPQFKLQRADSFIFSSPSFVLTYLLS